MEDKLMFFSQNTTNLGHDHYGLGEKLLEYDHDNNDINRIIERIYLIKSTGVAVHKQKNIESDVEGILLDIEFVLSIYPTDNDITNRKSSIICCGKLPTFDYSGSKLNSEEFQTIIEELEAKILKETENFAHQISRNLPHDLKTSGKIKYFLQRFYQTKNLGIFNKIITVLRTKIKNQLLLVLIIFSSLAVGYFSYPLILDSQTYPMPTSSVVTPKSTLTQSPNPKPTNPTSNPNPVTSENLPILHLGQQGDNVRLLQQKLLNFCYLKDKKDGVFGSKTEAAVKKFQNDFKLNSDGVVGRATWKALLKETPQPRQTKTNHGSCVGFMVQH